MDNRKHEVEIHTDTDIQDVQELEAYREQMRLLKNTGEKILWFIFGVAATMGFFHPEIFG
jgi:hypothetical protein